MELKILNKYNKEFLTSNFPLYIDLPYNNIKESLWVKISTIIGKDKAFRYKPNHVNIIVKYNNISYLVENYEKVIIMQKQKVEIPLNKKKIFQIDNKNYFRYKDKLYELKEENINYIAKKPLYLYQFLDEKNLPIRSVEFFYESVVDYMLSLRESKKSYPKYDDIIFNSKLKTYWPLLKLEEYNDIIDFLENNNLSNNYMNEINSIYNKYNNFMNDYESNLTQYNKKNIDYIISVDIISSFFVIANGDEENNYIHLNKIFYKLPISDNIPFMALKINGITRLKINESFKDKEMLKDWSLSLETKKNISEIDIENDTLQIIEPKGLLLKVKNGENYSNINIYANGRVTIRCHRKRSDDSNLILNCPNNIKKIIDYINKNIQEAFKNYPSSIFINKEDEIKRSMNVDISYRSLLTPDDFLILNNNFPFIRNYLFSDIFNELIITNKNMLSLVFKTIEVSKEDNSSKQGNGYFFNNIPLYNSFKFSIRNNSKFMDSSLVEVMGITSFSQIEILKSWINYLLFQLEREFKQEKEIKKNINKNTILRNIFEDYNSRDCSKLRQPLVDQGEPLDGSYALDYKGHKFICNNPDFKYPGFTVNNSVCCFKTDQRKKPKFIEMMNKENNYIVQPSNILYKNKNVILYNNDLYYLKDDKLNTIPNDIKKKIMDNEEEVSKKNRTYFFPENSFNKITSLPPINVCKNIKKENNNFICPEGQVIEYNIQGYPCCVIKKTIDRTIEKNNRKIEFFGHIITKNKILEPRRRGLLPDNIKKIFDELNTGFEVYRYGVVQGNNSFLSSVSVLLNKTFTYIQKEILKKLNMNLFLSLNNGELALDFNNVIKNFKKFLLDDKEVKTHIQYWDLVSYIFNVEIIIFDYENQTILCKSNNEELNYDNLFLFIIKYENNYEPIIFTNEFNYLQDIRLKPGTILDKMYNFICSPEKQIELKDIKYQILDNINRTKVKFLVFKDNFYLPVINKGPFPNIKIRSLNRKNPDAVKILIQSQSPKYSNLVKITGQVLDNNDNTILGLMTDKKIIIPVKKSKAIDDLEVIDYNYIPQADKKSSSIIKRDDRMDYIEEKETIEIMYHSLKYSFSQFYQNQKIKVEDFMKQYIFKDKNIISDAFSNILKLNEINYINKYKSKYGIKITLTEEQKVKIINDFYMYFQERLNNEIMNNPLILSGNIPHDYYSETYNENEYVFTDIKKLLTFLKQI